MMSLDEAIKHAKEVASEQERLMSRYDAASGYNRSGNEAIRTESAKKCEKCAEEHRQLAIWLRELKERRKAPEIITCGECVNFAERDFCKVAGHNVHRKSNCMQVFGAERKTE